ncbi:MAG: ATP-binding cassette domain-containing protein [Chloroflexi bacterium]|nr:ATP-binding cassette domain-containing protein [Chloroflexota bacterium]
MDKNLIEVKDLKMYFPVLSGIILPRKTGEIKAVDGVSFSIKAGQTLGLVGESGSGKTTVGMCILQLYRPTAGQVLYQEKELTQMKGKEIRLMRRKMQAIFQDPYGSLDPRMTATDIIGEAFDIHHLLPKKKYADRVDELLTLVGLNPQLANHFPHEFSAGERQRIGIARALAVNPEFIVCDEPVSSLDVCVQTQILCLLQDLQSKLNLTYLFIAHDLAVVGYISHQIGVMYLGRLMELGRRDRLYQNPLHPYTKALLAAVPIPDRALEKQRKRIPVEGDIASSMAPPPGCSFQPRCPEATPDCREVKPVMEEKEPEHWVACWKV